ncbi:uncharacterized protein V3H86_008525 isoform 2-T3 [Mergus octosetaceus]
MAAAAPAAGRGRAGPGPLTAAAAAGRAQTSPRSAAGLRGGCDGPRHPAAISAPPPDRVPRPVRSPGAAAAPGFLCPWLQDCVMKDTTCRGLAEDYGISVAALAVLCHPW